jgi:hypothetical protein
MFRQVSKRAGSLDPLETGGAMSAIDAAERLVKELEDVQYLTLYGQARENLITRFAQILDVERVGDGKPEEK